MKGDESKSQIVRQLPTPIAVVAQQLEFAPASPMVQLAKAFALYELVLIYAESVLRAQRREERTGNHRHRMSLGQHLLAVRTLSRELVTNDKSTAIRLWANDNEQVALERVVSVRNRWAHGVGGDRLPGNWRATIDDIWAAIRYLTESTLLLYLPDANQVFALQGPRGLYAPKATTPPSGLKALTESADWAHATTTQWLPPKSIGPQLILEFGRGQLLTLSPFLEYRQGSQGQHRVIFLGSPGPNREYWDPLGD